MNPPTIHPQQLATLLENNQPLDLIDVRTPAEFREVHASIARNVPLDRLNPSAVMAERNGSADDALYVICRTGTRAAQACQVFAKAGYTKVACVAGGTQAWESSGLAVVRGKAAVSLERQVRIAAGALILIAAVLAVAVHFCFAGLAALIGAGLVFSGITDTCGMAMILAQMPWNQVKADMTGEARCCFR